MLGKNKEGAEIKRLEGAPHRELDEFDYLALQFRELWVIVAWCIIGWLCFSIGILTMSSSLLGLLLVVAGLIFVGLPSYSALRSMGFKASLDWEMYRETRYSDGRVVREDMSGVFGLIKLFLYLFVAIAATPIRYIKYTIVYNKIWRETYKMKPKFTLSFWFPSVVGVGAFIVGILIIAIGLAILL